MCRCQLEKQVPSVRPRGHPDRGHRGRPRPGHDDRRHVLRWRRDYIIGEGSLVRVLNNAGTLQSKSGALSHFWSFGVRLGMECSLMKLMVIVEIVFLCSSWYVPYVAR
jgi:hypothetical protein